MARKWVLRAVVVAAWIAGLYSIELLTSDGDLQFLLGVAFTVVAGAVANRWWILLAPLVLLTGLFTLDATNPCDECREELEWLGQLFLGLILAASAAVVMAIGVGARRAGALIRRGRR